MRDLSNRLRWLPVASGRPAAIAVMAVLGLALTAPAPARAGKLSWLDEVVQEVVREAEAGGRVAVKGVGGDGASTALRSTGRLFTHEADEGLEILAKRSDDLARAGRRAETAS